MTIVKRKTPPAQKQRGFMLLQNLQLDVEWQLKLHILRTKIFFFGTLALTGLCLAVAVLSGFTTKPTMAAFVVEVVIALFQILCCYGVYSHVAALGVVTGSLVPFATNAINSLPFIDGLKSPLDKDNAKAAGKSAAYFGTLSSTPLWYIIAFQLRGVFPILLTYGLLSIGLKLLCYVTGDVWRKRVENFTLVMDGVGIALTIIFGGLFYNTGMTAADVWSFIAQGGGPLGELYMWWHNDLGTFMKLMMLGLIMWFITLVVRRAKSASEWGSFIAVVALVAILHGIGSFFTGIVTWAQDEQQKAQAAKIQMQQKAAGINSSAPMPISTNNTVSVPFELHTAAQWDEYGPGTDAAPAHLWARKSGSISYDFNLPMVKTSRLTVKLSSELKQRTSIDPKDGSDVALYLNGVKLETKSIIPDNTIGDDYNWELPAANLIAGKNTIRLEVKGGRENGLCIYSPIQISW